jgi:hypothetical protein
VVYLVQPAVPYTNIVYVPIQNYGYFQTQNSQEQKEEEKCKSFAIPIIHPVSRKNILTEIDAEGNETIENSNSNESDDSKELSPAFSEFSVPETVVGAFSSLINNESFDSDDIIEHQY